MAAALTHRNAARWTVALAVGLRQSEALALRWSDVDLDNGTLSVRRGLHRVSGRGLIYEEPKADRSRRNLALPTPLVQALRAHRAAQLEERIAAHEDEIRAIVTGVLDRLGLAGAVSTVRPVCAQ